MYKSSRRLVLKMGFGATAAAMLGRSASGVSREELKLPDGAQIDSWDFASKPIDQWTVVTGQWVIREMVGAPGGSRRVLMQLDVRNTYNVAVAPLGPYSDVDVTMKFRPISGQQDASGGIVFRFSEGRYYLIRANALENNFRFYYYDRDRRMLSSASVRAPALGQWHTVRAVAVGNRVQGWLDGTMLLDARDARFGAGRIGLWTKADSITAFDQLTVRGIPVAK
jgi:hypothetical protein